jgi:hypothetical protein
MTVVEPGGFRTDWAGASMTFTEPMEEYEAAIGPFREFMKRYAGTEPGDPVKAAGVLFAISRMSEPPMRLVLGRFAKQHMKEGYEMSLAELVRWSELTLSTDFDDAEAHALPK